MEESTQRRERLKAMRLEASQEAATNDGPSTVSLANPLLESTTNPESQAQSVSQSFNYYTNPMAAYSGNKQSRPISPQISPNYSSMPQRLQTNQTFPSPSLQPHINNFPNPRMQQPQGQYANPSWNSSGPRPGGYRGPGQGGYPGPRFTNNPGHGSGRGYPSPRFTNNPGFGSGQGYPSPDHGSGQGGYPSAGPNQGRGQFFRDNMSSGPSYGRGMGSGSGQGRGRGRGGAHNHVTADDRPDRFFRKSMVEDPWKFLEPVVWKSHKKQWLPHDAKKPRVSESPKQSSSQPSLAEMLAASFNEATNDE